MPCENDAAKTVIPCHMVYEECAIKAEVQLPLAHMALLALVCWASIGHHRRIALCFVYAAPRGSCCGLALSCIAWLSYTSTSVHTRESHFTQAFCVSDPVLVHVGVLPIRTHLVHFQCRSWRTWSTWGTRYLPFERVLMQSSVALAIPKTRSVFLASITCLGPRVPWGFGFCTIFLTGWATSCATGLGYPKGDAL